jgi:ADP-ribose pyrophosphatase YjhB (NUDIX family)
MIKHCTQCGQAVEQRRTHGALRPVCLSCGHIHFIDPKVAVAVVIEREGALLLIQRKGAPEAGKWSVPAGYVDAGEDPARAAEREAREETGLEVRVTALWDVIAKSDPAEGADILIVYAAEVIGGALQAGDDAAQAVFHTRDQLPPVDQIAFASAKRLLARWREAARDP